MDVNFKLKNNTQNEWSDKPVAFYKFKINEKIEGKDIVVLLLGRRDFSNLKLTKPE